MRVHIICRDSHKSRILPRLANALTESARWTQGNKPDPHATINYFFPYLEAVGSKFKDTPTAAWFTHRDTFMNGKAELWDQVAERVDLRLTSVRQNLLSLMEYGPADLVTPYVDMSKFVLPKKRTRADMPIIGVSGWVYPGGRKGEGLVKQLVEERRDLHVVASGDGWPVSNCKMWGWDSLHLFYQSLDIHLTTSLLEGVPMGPLEALACGVPVVIPFGVGLLDDLPSMPGIARYEAGNYEEMITAIDLVLATDYNPYALRNAIQPYSLVAWRETHEQAFEDLLWPPSKPEHPPDWQGHSGIYCVAFGAPSRNMASKLIPSIKQHMNIPVCFVGTSPLDTGEDCYIEHPDQDIGGRIAKIKMYDLVPDSWQYVLYLDADTEIVSDVSFLFQALADGWELIICKNPGKYHLLSEMVRPDNHLEADATFKVLGSRELLQLNGGVMAFRRNERVKRFFELWYEEWDRWGKRDQAALHRALWRQPLRVLVLGNEWNTITRYDDADITAGILHYPTTARRWQGRIDGRLDSEEAWSRVNA